MVGLAIAAPRSTVSRDLPGNRVIRSRGFIVGSHGGGKMAGRLMEFRFPTRVNRSEVDVSAQETKIARINASEMIIQRVQKL